MSVLSSDTHKTGGDYVQWMKDLEARYRQVSGLKDRSRYVIFYCPVRPAPLLVLGINPGGHPDDFYPDGVRQRSDPTKCGAASASYFEHGEHSMLDCDWPANTTVEPLSTLLGTREAIRDKVVKTNLAFRRSPNTKMFKTIHGMTLTRAYREAQPFIREIVELVQPRLVVLEGSILKDFKKMMEIVDGKQADRPVKTLHRGWQRIDLYRAEHVTIPGVGGTVLVVQLAHPSYHGAKYGTEGIGNRIQKLFDGPL